MTNAKVDYSKLSDEEFLAHEDMAGEDGMIEMLRSMPRTRAQLEKYVRGEKSALFFDRANIAVQQYKLLLAHAAILGIKR